MRRRRRLSSRCRPAACRDRLQWHEGRSLKHPNPARAGQWPRNGLRRISGQKPEESVEVIVESPAVCVEDVSPFGEWLGSPLPCLLTWRAASIEVFVGQIIQTLLKLVIPHAMLRIFFEALERAAGDCT